MLNHKNSKQGNRGDFTESIINNTGEYLLKEGLALINKVPTPIKVLKVKGAMITSGFFEEKSIVDYIGVCQGLPISFDAKETNQISLPLSSIPRHQLSYIKNFIKQGGYSFILCNFKKLDKYYLIPGEIVLRYHCQSLKGGRKSIPEKKLKKEYQIKFDKWRKILNFLPQLNQYYNDRENNKL